MRCWNFFVISTYYRKFYNINTEHIWPSYNHLRRLCVRTTWFIYQHVLAILALHFVFFSLHMIFTGSYHTACYVRDILYRLKWPLFTLFLICDVSGNTRTLPTFVKLTVCRFLQIEFIKMAVFWYVTPCSLVGIHRRSRA
jgi:hypothetical protein